MLAVPVGDGEGALLGMQNMAVFGRELFPGGINVCLLRADGRILTAAPEFSPFLRELPEPVVRETTGRRRVAEQLRLF